MFEMAVVVARGDVCCSKRGDDDGEEGDGLVYDEVDYRVDEG